MPEINLPTKVGQDSIKQDTANILANFPISGGIDWSKSTAGGFYKSPEAHYTNNVVSITGKGILTCLRAPLATGTGFRIEVDGKTTEKLDLSMTTGSNLSLLLPFNTSIKVSSSQAGSSALYNLI